MVCEMRKYPAHSSEERQAIKIIIELRDVLKKNAHLNYTYRVWTVFVHCFSFEKIHVFNFARDHFLMIGGESDSIGSLCCKTKSTMHDFHSPIFRKTRSPMTFGCRAMTLFPRSCHDPVNVNVPCCEYFHLIFDIHDKSSYP